MVSKAEMISRGKAKYEEKIRALGGASAYFSCGAQGGMDVAVCLHGLKKALTETDWARAWEAAMA